MQTHLKYLAFLISVNGLVFHTNNLLVGEELEKTLRQKLLLGCTRELLIP
jgi:hypothetical protein